MIEKRRGRREVGQEWGGEIDGRWSNNLEGNGYS